MNIFNFKKISFIISFVILIFLWSIIGLNNTARAVGSCGASPNFISTTQQTTVSFTSNNPALANKSYTLVVRRPGFVVISDPITTDANGNFSRSVGPFDVNAVYTFDFQRPDGSIECSSTFTVQATTGAGACPQFDAYSPAEFYEDTDITAYFEPVTGSDPLRTNPASFGVKIDDKDFKSLTAGAPVGPGGWQANIGKLKKGNHILKLYFAPNTIPPTTEFCYQLPAITVKEGKTPGGGTSTGTSGQNPCPGGVCETALGDIPTNPTAFAGKILGIAIGLAGGIALILMVIGSVRVLTSSGDQQKLAGGRDIIVGAVAGLLFLIFSVLILKFIGLNILGITFG